MNGSQRIVLKTIEIRWHWRAIGLGGGDSSTSKSHSGAVQSAPGCEGVVSIDHHPTRDRICTAGLDGTVKIWECPHECVADFVRLDQFDVVKACEFVASLKTDANIGPPNCARWSPCGHLIVSAHDNGGLALWARDEAAEKRVIAADDEAAFNREQWSAIRSLGGHLSDVRDVAFSPDSRYIISGAVDGHVIVHSAESGYQLWKSPAVEPLHKNACQGVSWDPWNHIVVSAGADRAVFVHSLNLPDGSSRRFNLSHCRSVKDKESAVKFQGESGMNFYRRMSWSPDGTLLAMPAGVTERAESDARHCAYIFLRNNLERPAIRLTIKGKDPVVGARWAPCFFERFEGDTMKLHQDAKGLWGHPAYRMTLALWTEDAVYVYTTDAAARYTHLTDLHLDSITDVAWSPRGDFLFVSSLDGYVTAVHFSHPIGRSIHDLSTIATCDALRVPSKVRSALAAQATSVEAGILDSQSGSKKVVAVVKKKKRVEDSAKPAAAVPVPAAAAAAAAVPIVEADPEQLGAIFDEVAAATEA